MNWNARIDTKKPGQLVLTNDPPDLVRALGRFYGRHAATLTPEERKEAAAKLIEFANDIPPEFRKTIMKLRAETVATVW